MIDRVPLMVVVNDDAAARYLLSRILRSVGWRVEEAATAHEGLKLVKSCAPEVVVLDVKLPDLIGYEVCRQLKKDPATASVLVIQTSATFVTSEGKARGLDSGADAYLAQPFESVELIAMVRSLLRLRSSEMQARQRADQLIIADQRKNEFLAMLGHELRNPLSAMLAASSMLERGDTSGDEAKQTAATIHRQTRHLARLVDDLLDVARVTSGKIQVAPTPMDLCELVRRVTEEHTPTLIRRQLDLNLDIAVSPLFVEGDSTRLEQVVSNLVTNAIKYSNACGTIDIQLQTVDEDGSSRALFTVCDQGVGLSPANVDAVWDLFFQADTSLARSKSGLGIGLTLVKRIIELHGGAVSARSDGLGKGSEFSFWLPQIEAPIDEPKAEPVTEAAQAGLKIGLIDDNMDSCELYAMFLERIGHDVKCAYDGTKGLEMLTHGTFDAAIIDIGLPGMDGYEVGKRVRKHFGGKAPYLIALTGYGRPEDREAALSAGFDEHLVKPIEIARVEQLLSAVSHKRHSHSATRL